MPPRGRCVSGTAGRTRGDRNLTSLSRGASLISTWRQSEDFVAGTGMAESTADFHTQSADDPRDSLSESMDKRIDAAAQLNFRVLALGRHEQGSKIGRPDTLRILHPVVSPSKAQPACCPAVCDKGGLGPAHLCRATAAYSARLYPSVALGRFQREGMGRAAHSPHYEVEGGERRF